MKNFKKLKVWQNGIEIVKHTYQLTSLLPEEEKYNLSSQMKRSSVSIPSNIAEGSNRRSEKDYLRFLEIAQGSCFELETQLIIAQELGFIKKGEGTVLQQAIDDEEMMLYSFMNKLNI